MPDQTSRRSFLKDGFFAAAALGLGGAATWAVRAGQSEPTVWQLDPNVCVQCNQCATACVLKDSAVKCVHAYALCGYCEICNGFLEVQRAGDEPGAENQLCPTGAIRRTFIEDPYYEYTVDEAKCLGCARCVQGCLAFGNGSLYLQVRHDRCLNCNECAIAVQCPSQAFRRVPASRPYLARQAR